MRAFAFVMAGAVIICHPAEKALAVSYSVTDLGAFGFGIASRVNNNGQVAGRTLGARAAVFSNGTMANIAAASNYPYSCASGVNASGQVVGRIKRSGVFVCDGRRPRSIPTSPVLPPATTTDTDERGDAAFVIKAVELSRRGGTIAVWKQDCYTPFPDPFSRPGRRIAWQPPGLTTRQ